MPIQYPIKESDRFTIYDTNTQSIVKDSFGRKMTNQPWGSQDKSKMIEGLADNIKILIEVRENQPSFDYWTQKLEGNINFDVENETVTYSYDIVSLTQDEINLITPAYYEYNNNGIKLGVQDSDQSAFANLLLLINETNMALTDTLSIKDIYKNSFNITVAEFKEMIVAYGLYCYNLFNS